MHKTECLISVLHELVLLSVDWSGDFMSPFSSQKNGRSLGLTHDPLITRRVIDLYTAEDLLHLKFLIGLRRFANMGIHNCIIFKFCSCLHQKFMLFSFYCANWKIEMYMYLSKQIVNQSA